MCLVDVETEHGLTIANKTRMQLSIVLSRIDNLALEIVNIDGNPFISLTSIIIKNALSIEYI